MALTKAQIREILSSAGVSSENIPAAVDKIIDGHLASIEALREEVSIYKQSADKLSEAQHELDTLKAINAEDWKAKYTAEHETFEHYRTTVESERTSEKKKSLYREVLKFVGVDERRIDSIMRVTDVDGLVLKDGKLDNEANLRETAKNEWADFIPGVERRGADVDNPPDRGVGMNRDAFITLSLSERMAYANAHPAQVAEWLK